MYNNTCRLTIVFVSWLCIRENVYIPCVFLFCWRITNIRFGTQWEILFMLALSSGCYVRKVQQKYNVSGHLAVFQMKSPVETLFIGKNFSVLRSHPSKLFSSVSTLVYCPMKEISYHGPWLTNVYFRPRGWFQYVVEKFFIDSKDHQFYSMSNGGKLTSS